MENQIIDVNYTELEAESTETLTNQVNFLWNRLELVGQMGVMIAANVGRILLTIKERTPHGEWGEWCKKNLDFSERKAQDMMKIAKEFESENSLFSNPQMFADLSISKVYTILSAPKEVQKQLVESGNLNDITVQELKEEIKSLKAIGEEKTNDISAMEAEIKNKDAAIAELNNEITNLKQDSAQSVDADTIKALEAEKKELQVAATKAKDDLAKAKDKLKKEQASVEDKLSKARAEGKAEALEEFKKIKATNDKEVEDALIEASNEIARLEKEVKAGEDMSAFRINSQYMQQNFMAMLGLIEDTDNEVLANRMKGALKKLMETLMESLE